MTKGDNRGDSFLKSGEKGERETGGNSSRAEQGLLDSNNSQRSFNCSQEKRMRNRVFWASAGVRVSIPVCVYPTRAVGARSAQQQGYIKP